MGTRSLTRVFDENNKELVCIYRQMDGYPGGMGKDLAEFLTPIAMVNGIGGDNRQVANGYGCLAAQLIKELKDGPGSIYIYPPCSNDCGEEYEYHIKPTPPPHHVKKNALPSPGSPLIAVHEVDNHSKARELKLLFECSPAEYDKLLTTYEALDQATA